MKKLLLLTILFVTPAYGAFDFEGLVGDIVESGVKTIIKEAVGPQSSLTPEQLIEIVTSNDKKVKKFISEDSISFRQKKDAKTIASGCQSYKGKYVEATKLCEFSSQLSIAENNIDKLQEISELNGHIKEKVNKHNRYIDSYGRDDISQVEAIIKDSRLLEAKLNEYEKYRINTSVKHLITNGKSTLAGIEKKQISENKVAEKLDKERKMKAAEVAKAKEREDVIAELPLMLNSVYKRPYQACLAEGEKFIQKAKLISSEKMSQAKVKEARVVFKEQCSCVYVNIHRNSTSASQSARSDLADDLTKLEKAKVKNAERKMSKWEAKRFRDNLTDGDTMYVSYMNATLKCE